MKRIAVVVLLVAMVATGAEAEKDLSLTISSKVYSKYLGSTTGSICHEDPVLQTDLFFTLPHGLYFDIWHSSGLDGTGLSSDGGDEIDFTVGWTGEIEKLQNIKLDLGISYFDCYDLFKMPSGDFILPYLNVSKEFPVLKDHCLEPFVFFQFPYSAKGNEYGNGFIVRSGMFHHWNITDSLAICQRVNLTFDDGAWGNDSGLLGEYRFDASWKITDRITLDVISVKVARPFSNFSDGRDGTEAVYGAGIKICF